ncbi:flagellar brake protein [Salisediminibacterium halotolerans]|uniref:C-di-GMP-binding flagellar brake protein YcgR, contains PilZNR and PilZ domains n=1 Tax=Salisediminibacterium halotolerans TaxID=517425 RepID=A0A1H9P555_9BACI|nr:MULTISPECIES: flagellar brake domain-containing protein [Salisediminibacterium]RLJ77962.1 c-di-GMP-binding flagellar brake protein YcgR [Actinophytocola xinjiangensis]RPE88700.1 c-di-GMP-binding flagellar brake protein YcgR [Salisediminibacterium halotolerans]TWG36939.1 c-di-GMP-binding flagellar brake protein YcgR [Salisediminibacterium halotolerans]SER43217.1 c-di-GMP-binding flagellar brake protein YcgR, contains PilZNR and PilZ domains [Salisediminibacterium haloalkalitolerans]GEL08100.
MIKVGTTVQMELEAGETGERLRYRSKVLDSSEEVLFIDYPVSENSGKPNYFLQGTQFRLWFVGNDEAVYLFETEVLGKSAEEVPMLKLKDPGSDRYLRVQRREYVRVETAVDCAVYSVDKSFSPFTSVTADISGGGIALILPENHGIEKNKTADLWMILPFRSGEMNYIHTYAETVRVIDDRRPLKASFKFTDISDHDRQAIVRYCFERQLEAKRKERLNV